MWYPKKETFKNTQTSKLIHTQILCHVIGAGILTIDLLLLAAGIFSAKIAAENYWYTYFSGEIIGLLGAVLLIALYIGIYIPNCIDKSNRDVL